jgi:purine-nucleoside/S-methyl-5'-thioadenosine phosphorylase / adenosine deaminase
VSAGTDELRANSRTASSPSRAALSARFRAAGLDWIVPHWSAPPSVHAFFTTRNGGAGTDGSLDLGSGTAPGVGADPDHAIALNRRRVEAFLPAAPLWLEQVHGTDVVVDDPPIAPNADRPPRADAAVTRSAYVVLSVRVADCLPVLLSDREGAVVAAAHAGWRGLCAGVLENTVAAMRCAPKHVVAWLGPAIGQRAFEVGADVREAFCSVDPADADAFVPGTTGKWHADLALLAQRRLARTGVTDVTTDGHCTWSEPQRFFSFRRDRTPKRMAAFIWRAAP